MKFIVTPSKRFEFGYCNTCKGLCSVYCDTDCTNYCGAFETCGTFEA